MQGSLERMDAGVWLHRLLQVGLVLSVAAFFAFVPGCPSAGGGGEGEPECVAEGGACDDVNLCCEGFECVDGVCVAEAVDLCEGVECDEGFECDEATGECVEIPVDLCEGVVCDEGFECDPATGECVAIPVACVEDEDCDDEDLCTTDACVDEVCVFTPVECDEGFECDPETGDCVEIPVACEEDEDCDDEDLCTTDACVDNECVNTPVDCPEGEECDPATGDCVPTVVENDDLEAGNPDVTFDDLTAGTAATLTAPVATTPRQVTIDDCTCTWTVTPDRADAFDPVDACTTTYTPAVADTLICVNVVCIDADANEFEDDFCQDVVVTEEAPPVGFTVTIGDCPTADVDAGGTVDLTVTSANAEGTVTFDWDLTGVGTLDIGTGGLSATYTAPADIGGPVTITATGTDTFVTDVGTDGIEGTADDVTDTAEDSDECAFTVGVTELQVNAGDDRTVGVTAPTVIPLFGSFFDPGDCTEDQIQWQWTLVTAPVGAPDPAGTFTNSARLGTVADPVNFTLLNPQTGGEYLFRLDGNSPCSGSDTDEVVITVAPVPTLVNVQNPVLNRTVMAESSLDIPVMYSSTTNAIIRSTLNSRGLAPAVQVIQDANVVAGGTAGNEIDADIPIDTMGTQLATSNPTCWDVSMQITDDVNAAVQLNGAAYVAAAGGADPGSDFVLCVSSDWDVVQTASSPQVAVVNGNLGICNGVGAPGATVGVYHQGAVGAPSALTTDLILFGRSTDFNALPTNGSLNPSVDRLQDMIFVGTGANQTDLVFGHAYLHGIEGTQNYLKNDAAATVALAAANLFDPGTGLNAAIIALGALSPINAHAATGTAITDIALGDVNGDGLLDLIVGEAAGTGAGATVACGEVHVLMNDGDSVPFSGGFTRQYDGNDSDNAADVTMGLGGQVAAGDIDGDGRDDIIMGAAADCPFVAAQTDGAIYIIYGKGDSTTVLGSGLPTSGPCASVAGADTVTDDGDLVLARVGSDVTGRHGTRLKGLNDAAVGLGMGAGALGVCDHDNDGLNDVIALGQISGFNNGLLVFKGKSGDNPAAGASRTYDGGAFATGSIRTGGAFSMACGNVDGVDGDEICLGSSTVSSVFIVPDSGANRAIGTTPSLTFNVSGSGVGAAVCIGPSVRGGGSGANAVDALYVVDSTAGEAYVFNTPIAAAPSVNGANARFGGGLALTWDGCAVGDINGDGVADLVLGDATGVDLYVIAGLE